MNNPLIIRADASARIGTGHVMRCMALGQAWQDVGGEVIFLTCCENAALLERLRDEDFKVVEIRDRDELISCIPSDLRFDASNTWVVLDGYHFGLKQQRQVQEAGYKLLLVDDYCHLSEYACDILVNQNISAPELDYHINMETRQLLGCDYAMLRREFRKKRVKTEQKNIMGATNLLVTLGGADPDNVTSKVIDALAQTEMNGLIAKVIVGSANPNWNALVEAANSISHIELIHAVKDMPALMDWADMAITAGGSTCWELCYMGVPFTTVVLAENQLALANTLQNRKLAPCLGKNPTVAKVIRGVEVLLFELEKRHSMAEAGRSLVDGFGVDRILYPIARDMGVNIFNERLSLRLVRKADCKLLWEWANDPIVRDNSYNPDPIPLENHKDWLEEKIRNESCLMLILNLDEVPVGQIRFDRKADVATIGFSVDQKFRGLGLGQKIVELSLAQAIDYLKVKILRAEVFEGNCASKTAFINAGFEWVDTSMIKGIMSDVFIRRWP